MVDMWRAAHLENHRCRSGSNKVSQRRPPIRLIAREIKP